MCVRLKPLVYEGAGHAEVDMRWHGKSESECASVWCIMCTAFFQCALCFLPSCMHTGMCGESEGGGRKGEGEGGGVCIQARCGWDVWVAQEPHRKGGGTVASKMIEFIRGGLMELSDDSGALPECTYFTLRAQDLIDDMLYDLQAEFPEVVAVIFPLHETYTRLLVDTQLVAVCFDATMCICTRECFFDARGGAGAGGGERRELADRSEKDVQAVHETEACWEGGERSVSNMKARATASVSSCFCVGVERTMSGSIGVNIVGESSRSAPSSSPSMLLSLRWMGGGGERGAGGCAESWGLASGSTSILFAAR